MGTFELFVADRFVSMPLGVQRVVAFVALQGRAIARSYVVGNLWPDSTEEHARANLRSALWRLRRLKHDVLVADGAQIHLAAHVRVDATEIARVASESGDGGDHPQQNGSPVIFSGELLPGWYEDWVVMARERLRFSQLRALEARGAHLLAKGRLPEAEEAYRAAADLEPFKETVQRGLIQVLLEAGSPGEAIHRYQSYRTLLREELGAEPSRQMTALLEGVTAG